MAGQSDSDPVATRLLETEARHLRRIGELQAALDARTEAETVLAGRVAASAEREAQLAGRAQELEATLRRLLSSRAFRLASAMSGFLHPGASSPAESVEALLSQPAPEAPVPTDSPDRIDPCDVSAVGDAFHRIYYEDEPRPWENTSWLGTRIFKLPLDMWIYQELLWELRPDVVVECGTNRGGSAAYMASILDLIGGGGHIVTIDIEEMEGRPVHDRISYLTGSSTDPDIVATVRERAAAADRVLVVLDSDHSAAHVREELECYQDVVTVGSYLIVEDTNVNGHPVFPQHGPGPMEAVEDFLSTTDRFVVDPTREKFHLTFNPRGYLLRVR